MIERFQKQSDSYLDAIDLFSHNLFQIDDCRHFSETNKSAEVKKKIENVVTSL